MGHFAKVEEGIVVDLIKAEQADIDSGRHGEPSLWIQTSYNTFGGQYFTPESGSYKAPLRYNFATIGGYYDAEADAFYAKEPRMATPEEVLEGSTEPAWILNRTTFKWELKPEYAKPEVPVGGHDYWIWAERRRKWIYEEPVEYPAEDLSLNPTQENNP
jgi:hypothetical protein